VSQLSSTFSTYDAAGLREELADTISNIDPTERPFMSAIGRQSLKSKHPEWQTDSLAAAVSTNAQIEGDDIGSTFTQLTATVRVGNYTQIARKLGLISGTEEAVDKAGRSSEVDYQVAKAGQELLRDVETQICGNQASVAGNDSTARVSGSLEAWITTNGSRGAGAGADGGFNTGTGIVDAAVDGTLRDLTEEMWQQALQDAWTSGGKPTLAIVAPKHKRMISKFQNATAGGTATVTRFDDNDDRMLNTAIDVYKHDFGVVRVVPSRFCRTRTITIIDPSFWALGWLRSLHPETLAKTGDSTKFFMVGEYSLISKNQKSSATIADLN
jgi:hypothetical protein